jgi:hypothetical protein
MNDIVQELRLLADLHAYGAVREAMLRAANDIENANRLLDYKDSIIADYVLTIEQLWAANEAKQQ